MIAYFRKARCMAGVSYTLEMIGYDKESAMKAVRAYPDYFKIIAKLTHGLPSRAQNIIATLVFIERLIAEKKGKDIELIRQRDTLYEGFKYQLKHGANWQEIAKCYCHTMHLVIGVYMPTEAEILELFAPENIEVDDLGFNEL